MKNFFKMRTVMHQWGMNSVMRIMSISYAGQYAVACRVPAKAYKNTFTMHSWLAGNDKRGVQGRAFPLVIYEKVYPF